MVVCPLTSAGEAEDDPSVGGASLESSRPLTVRPARSSDLAVLVAIERAAGETFRPLGMDVVADDEPPRVEQLAIFAQEGRAFVAVDRDDRPVGYLLLELVDGAAHIEQVSVHSSHARQGTGRALIDRAATRALDHGLRALTLTTYVTVPWNGPYYERLAFRYLTEDEETDGLRAIRGRERRPASMRGRAPA